MKRLFLNYLVIAALVASAAFTSCDRDKPEPTGQIAVNMRADITSLTTAITPTSTLKVANDQWEAADKVGLYMKKSGQSLTAFGAVYSVAANVQMSIDGQSLVANPPVMYPTSGNVDFIAYYPYSTSVSSDYTVAVNLAGQSEGLPAEVLYSNNVTNQAPTESAVMLNFQYSLAKLEVTVSGGQNSTLTESDFASMTASIDGLYTQANLQLSDCTFADKGVKQSITLRKVSNTTSSTTFEALILPTDEDITFLFTVSGNTYRYAMTADYASGNLYSLNFALDFPSFPEPTAVLLNAIIIPRISNPTQHFSIDATQKMTMTTEASEVTLYIGGTGTILINWGDGTPDEIYILSNDVYSNSYTHRYSDTSPHIITIIGENIRDLFCSNNHLTSLDVSKNTVLEQLDCRVNQLTNLDVSKNTTLTYLCCNNNQLINLDVTKNSALKILGCSNNQLTSLDVSKNTMLESLHCDNNPLTSLDVSNNTALITLECFNNQLASLDVSKNITLTKLWCINNELTASALNALFETLHGNHIETKSIYISGNPGTDNCDRSIAENKGWTVID